MLSDSQVRWLKRVASGIANREASVHLSSLLVLADDGSRFRRVLAATLGKRLTYRVLTAQNDAGFMGIK